LVCFGLALLSKEHAMCLPLLVVLCDLWRGRGDWRRWLPFFVLSGCYLALRTAVSGQVSQTTYWGGSLYATALTACRMAFRYAALLVAPVHLSVDWQPGVSYSLSSLAALASVAALAAAVVWAVWALARGSRAAFAVLWFLIALLPVSNVIPLKALMAERFLYLPSVGFCVVAAGAFAMRGRAEHLFLLMALCSVFAARTVHRNHDWRDDRALFARTVETCPRSYNAYFNLGGEYGAAGQAQRAVAAYRTAMRIEPRYGDAALRLARIHRDQGQLDAALDAYRAAAEVAEHPADIHNEIGNLLYLKGELGGAAEAYRRALGLDPRHSQAHFNLGCVHLKKGDLPEAVSAFRAHLRVRPLDAEAHNCLGHAFSRLGDWPKAVDAYQAALKLNPNLVMAHFNLGEAYAGQGRVPEALEAYESFLAKWKGSPERAEVARARRAALKGQR